MAASLTSQLLVRKAWGQHIYIIYGCAHTYSDIFPPLHLSSSLLSSLFSSFLAFIFLFAPFSLLFCLKPSFFSLQLFPHTFPLLVHFILTLPVFSVSLSIISFTSLITKAEGFPLSWIVCGCSQSLKSLRNKCKTYFYSMPVICLLFSCSYPFNSFVFNSTCWTAISYNSRLMITLVSCYFALFS